MGSLSSTSGFDNELSPAIDEEGLRSLIQNQLRQLQHCFHNLDLSQIRAFILDIIGAPGAVFFSGVGKSGLIAAKLSQTLTSLGFNRFAFLCPVAALHGDIGAIFPSDLLVLISKSGSSDELINLIPCARAKGARLISVTSVQDSPLSAFCDMDVYLPLEREVCPFGLAPLTSPTIQLLFGDIVVAAIIRVMRLTKEHSGGNIGKRLISKEISQEINDQVLGELLENRLRLFKHSFDNLDLGQTQNFIKAILNAPSAVFFSSVGKSDFVGNKISQTLTSLGFNRFAFLCPVAALHDGIGALFSSDILILISTSGSSDELLKLALCAHAKGARVISVTSVQNNPLSTLSNMNVYLPLENDAFSLGLAPLSSSAIQLLFGDTVAAAIMNSMGLTMEQYASNHPAGKIGKRLIFKVKDLMKRQENLPLCKEEDMIMDQLTELTSKGCGCLLVIDAESHLIGTFTDGDLRRTLKTNREGVFQLTVGEMCNRLPRTINPNAMAVEAMQKMEGPPSPVQFLPVVDDQNVLIGIITLHMLVSSGL